MYMCSVVAMAEGLKDTYVHVQCGGNGRGLERYNFKWTLSGGPEGAEF